MHARPTTSNIKATQANPRLPLLFHHHDLSVHTRGRQLAQISALRHTLHT
ncbi:hypothetical protein EDWATA_03939 [Edwardsiella tarda ATCC 23685]|uniref:Uncharacterized protein n=1 Tax=Edwardsiella tarda ATCC 23685 TaxID=500638 RepID=D4FAW9_EDWTA|nr:hypothetical protein EDWATA_03939 [Edwardsiella tarda ATCC 23685]